MDYYDIISLSDAKKYLRLDSGFTDDDDDIKRMISGAFGYCEMVTNHLVFKRKVTYHKFPTEERLIVYDYPIEDNTGKVGTGFTDFGAVDSITLDVGYAKKDDVPPAIIEAAMQIIELWYYGKEGSLLTSNIPDKVNQVLWQY